MKELGTPGTNMFGIVPCPRCGSKYRWPSTASYKEHPNSIICDDCKYTEPIEKERE